MLDQSYFSLYLSGILMGKPPQLPWEPPTTSPLTSLEVGRFPGSVLRLFELRIMRYVRIKQELEQSQFCLYFFWDFDGETSLGPLGSPHDLSPDLPGGREVSSECLEAVGTENHEKL